MSSCQVIDACVLTLREILLDKLHPPEPRADILSCQFISSLAKLFSKFRKMGRKENFEFEVDAIEFVRSRAKQAQKEWMADIDYIYFPFNVDKQRWTSVMVDLHSSTLTVLDPSADERRGSRLKPELDFVCEMFPYLVCKAAVNVEMKNYSLEPLTFKRDGTVPQASALSKTGLFALVFIEAHATDGLPKVLALDEEILPARGKQLAVAMYEHCCGDVLP